MTAAAAPPLPDELVEEFLVRVSPDDPKRLLRAALVCKRWCRLLSDPRFRRRYRDLHRAPPMLGFLTSRRCYSTSFYSTSSFHRPRAAWSRCRALDARHGRVLLQRWRPGIDGSVQLNRLVVWDPITNQEREVPMQFLTCRPYPDPGSWSAAVICAVDDGCDHLDCHCGPFRVIFVATLRRQVTACEYSLDADAWGEPTTMEAPGELWNLSYCNSKVLVANALYLLDTKILRYDLSAREMSMIQLPSEVGACQMPAVLTTVEDGRLGLAIVHNSRLSLWSMSVGPDGDVPWTRIRVIDCEKLFPHSTPSPRFGLCGSADAGVIFVVTGLQIFMVNLKSGRIMKVGPGNSFDRVLPFISFCTPAVGTVCTDEGSGAGAPSA